jgi:hypothetical protein
MPFRVRAARCYRDSMSDHAPSEHAPSEHAPSEHAPSEHAPEAEAREFATAFQSFLDWVHETGRDDGERHQVVPDLITGFLGPERVTHSVVTRDLPPFEQVNLQTALDAWSARPGRSVEVHGISVPPHHSPPELQQLIAGDSLPSLRLTAPALSDLPNGPGSTLGCLKFALLLVSDSQDGHYVLMIQGPGDHHPGLDVEVAGLGVDRAQRVLAELDELRGQLNVYRGHLLDVSLNPMGGMTLGFAAATGLGRDAVVLPDATLTRIERHALGVAAHRDALLAAGQHLKRGLLLYGPPGTGKTALCRVLAAELVGEVTVVLCDARAIGGRMSDVYAELTRLAPALVVLEDLDLVVGARRSGRDSGLHEFLTALDGVMSGHDGVVTIATANDVKALDDAALRAAEFDRIIEIPLPDAKLRALILRRYLGELAAGIDVSAVAGITDGASGADVRELVRRAVLVEGDGFTTATLLRIARDGLGAEMTGQYL